MTPLMETERIAAALSRLNGTCLTNEPMDRHTTFRAGGPADIFFMPSDESSAADAMRIAADCDIYMYMLGAGSNTVVPSRGIRGMVICLAEEFSRIDRRVDTLYAEAGAKLPALAREAYEAGLTGLEFASGIPGSVGGATAMNAGAYGGQLSDVIEYSRVLLNGEILEIPADGMGFSYRHSLPLDKGGTVLGTSFRLRPGIKDDIAAAMRELNARRRDKQPLEFPSAGSVFKRPEGHFAGALIEQAGLKGLRVGDAEVSEKHAGFIINRGNATGDEILELMALVQTRVYEHSGIMLEREVRVPGEDVI